MNSPSLLLCNYSYEGNVIIQKKSLSRMKPPLHQDLTDQESVFTPYHTTCAKQRQCLLNSMFSSSAKQTTEGRGVDGKRLVS